MLKSDENAQKLKTKWCVLVQSSVTHEYCEGKKSTERLVTPCLWLKDSGECAAQHHLILQNGAYRL